MSDYGIKSTNTELYSKKGAVKTGNIDQSQYLDSLEYEETQEGIIASAKSGVAVQNARTMSANGGFEAGSLQSRNPRSPLPEYGTEVFPFDSPLCQSTDGRIPVNRDLSFQTGKVGEVENPWFKERRWTVPIGLVAAYTMNAGAGTVLRDDSGNFRDGTISGATWTNDATKGWCLDFDGTNDTVISTNVTGIPVGAADRTIAFWLYWDTASAGSQVSIKASSGQNYNVGLRDVAGTKYIFADGVNANNAHEITGAEIPGANGWHHIAWVNTSATTANYYLDGAFVKEFTHGTAINTGTAAQIELGHRSDGSVYFNGLIWKPMIYNRELTSTEVAALYNETSPYVDTLAPPCDNAIWCGKTTTNLVRSTDLSNAVWTKSTTYIAAGYANVYDPDLQKTVLKWNKGSDANESLLTDTAAATSLAAGTYVTTVMVKCNYAIVLRARWYGATPGELYSSAQLIPANTWTLATFRFTTAVATYTELGYYFILQAGANFEADIEFRACDPYVALETYPVPFAPTTRPDARLYYNYTWPQQGTVLLWVKPQFGFDYATANKVLFNNDHAAANTSRIVGYYDITNDRFTIALYDNSGNGDLAYTEAITTNEVLQKWWLLAVTYDIPNDDLKIYAYSVDYPDGMSVTNSTADLGTNTLTNKPYLDVGCNMGSASPANNTADSFICGLVIDDEVWTEAKIKGHYTRGRSYTSGRRVPLQEKGMFFEGGDGQINGKLELGDGAHGKKISLDGNTGGIAGLGVYQQTTATAANLTVLATGQILRSTSALKYKTEVEDISEKREEEVLSLRPVWYRSKCLLDRKDWSYYGLIADEVAKVDPRLVQWREGEQGLVAEGVDYIRVFTLLLKSYQEFRKEVEVQFSFMRKEIEGLRDQVKEVVSDSKEEEEVPVEEEFEDMLQDAKEEGIKE